MICHPDRLCSNSNDIYFLSVRPEKDVPPLLLHLWGFFKDLLSSIPEAKKDGWCFVLYGLWSPSSQNVWFMNKIDYFIFAHTKKIK